MRSCSCRCPSRPCSRAATAGAPPTTRSARPTRRSKEIKLEGEIVQFVYRNPHSFVHIEAPDDDGASQRWAVEWGGTGQLARAGVKRDSLKVGDKVVISGRPSRVPGEYRC